MSPHNRRKAVFVEPQQKIGWQIAVERLGGQPFPAWTLTQTLYCVPVSDDLRKRCWSRGSAVGCLMTAFSTLVRHLQHAGCSAWPPLLAGIKIVPRWSPLVWLPQATDPPLLSHLGIADSMAVVGMWEKTVRDEPASCLIFLHMSTCCIYCCYWGCSKFPTSAVRTNREEDSP